MEDKRPLCEFCNEKSVVIEYGQFICAKCYLKIKREGHCDGRQTKTKVK